MNKEKTHKHKRHTRRFPIPVDKPHKDRKNDYQRKPKHVPKEKGNE